MNTLKFLGVLGLAVAFSPAQAEGNSFHASKIDGGKGNSAVASGVAVEMRNGTLFAGSAELPTWNKRTGQTEGVIRFEQGGSYEGNDGLLLQFEAADLDVLNGDLSVHGPLFLTHAPEDFSKMLVQPKNITTEYTCRLGRLYANGQNTYTTSVCLQGGTKLYCQGSNLRVRTFATECIEP